jgi:hypothetical protein
MVAVTEGLHVSSIQGPVDFAAVRDAGYRWCYIRLTRGIAEVDTLALRHYAGCLDNGVLPGFYHRAFNGVGTPRVQAEWFVRHLPATYAAGQLTLSPCVDYEDQLPGQEWCSEFLGRQRELAGRADTCLYTAGSYVDSFLGGEGWMDPQMWLWIADTGRWTGATKGRPRYGTSRVRAHHYGQSVEVPGLGGRLCDVDVAMGDVRAMTGKAAS